ncbi:hypothetical protein NDU88_003685 [Pleurodeles waltl]|uniref:Uncharacterized protein n=1 Tax=Pleurodeles waltl TaxID=8319 RepID=A0AAV7MT65_PLEWA|nr:hypothetical protein NDU88_003685 [Pleurodeles waltl]
MIAPVELGLWPGGTSVLVIRWLSEKGALAGSSTCFMSQVSGTMVTAVKGSESMTRNVSWFRKVTFEDLAEGLAADDCSMARPVSDGDESQCPDVRKVVRDQSPPQFPVTSSPVVPLDGRHSQSHQYSLQPNPAPSQRLRDFVCLLSVSNV